MKLSNKLKLLPIALLFFANSLLAKTKTDIFCCLNETWPKTKTTILENKDNLLNNLEVENKRKKFYSDLFEFYLNYYLLLFNQPIDKIDFNKLNADFWVFLWKYFWILDKNPKSKLSKDIEDLSSFQLNLAMLWQVKITINYLLINLLKFSTNETNKLQNNIYYKLYNKTLPEIYEEVMNNDFYSKILDTLKDENYRNNVIKNQKIWKYQFYILDSKEQKIRILEIFKDFYSKQDKQSIISNWWDSLSIFFNSLNLENIDDNDVDTLFGEFLKNIDWNFDYIISGLDEQSVFEIKEILFWDNYDKLVSSLSNMLMVLNNSKSLFTWENVLNLILSDKKVTLKQNYFETWIFKDNLFEFEDKIKSYFSWNNTLESMDDSLLNYTLWLYFKQDFMLWSKDLHYNFNFETWLFIGALVKKNKTDYYFYSIKYLYYDYIIRIRVINYVLWYLSKEFDLRSDSDKKKIIEKMLNWWWHIKIQWKKFYLPNPDDYLPDFDKYNNPNFSPDYYFYLLISNQNSWNKWKFTNNFNPSSRQINKNIKSNKNIKFTTKPKTNKFLFSYCKVA